MLQQLIHRIRSFADTEEGVTAIEYGLIAALIAVVIIGAMTAVGDELENIFNTWSSAVSEAVQSSQGS